MSNIDTLFDELSALEADKKRPPIHLWHPEREGVIDIRVDAQGQWFHEGQPFTRQALVNLFATILRKEEDDYFLVTPMEKLRIAVVDVPFMAIDMDVRRTGKTMDLMFHTNVGDHVMADETHRLEMRDERPYLHVRDQLYARLTRSVYYRLVDLGLEEEGALAVYSQGARFDLGSLQ